MIDHVSVAVRDLALSGSLYDTILAPLELTRLVTREATIGYGKRYPEFWLNLRPNLARVPVDTGVHICLRGGVPEGEPERCPRELLRGTHRHQDVGGLGNAGVARRPGRALDAARVEQHQQRVALASGE